MSEMEKERGGGMKERGDVMFSALLEPVFVQTDGLNFAKQHCGFQQQSSHRSDYSQMIFAHRFGGKKRKDETQRLCDGRV